MKKPSIMTVANVEILHAGIEYDLSTGPTTFTPEDLRDVVQAANEDSSIPSPRLKLGHIDPRYNGKEFDGTPNFGMASNLRLSENGMAVMADYVGVPRWLGEVLPYAYPSRSIEGFWDVESQMGKKYRFVLSACSLLGVQWPGVTVLEDLPMYYGDTIPEDVVIDDEIVEAVIAAAASKATGGDPVKLPFRRETSASANLDDVRRAFYSQYVPEHQSEGTLWWWIQAVLTDPNELVVEDDETGQLYKLSFNSDASGVVSFGDPEAVRVDCVPDDREMKKAAAVHVAATLAIGRNVLASWPNRDESVPTTASGGAMDPKEIRTRLGLAEDASDDQVREALRALNTSVGLKVEEEPEAPAATVTPPEEGAAKPQTPAEEAPAPAAVAASQGITPPPGVVLIDETALAEIRASGAAATALLAERRKEKREALVNAAMADGRIPPARREHWLTALEADEEGNAALLAKLAPGLVPVEERGHGHAPEGNNGEQDAATVSEWTAQLFPEVRSLREREAALASGGGLGTRSRIASDAHYTR